MARIKFSGTGFTPIPNQLIDLWPALRRLRIPVVLCGKKVAAQLVHVDRIIFEILFRFAFADRMNVRRGQKEIARLAGLGERQLRDRIFVLEAAGMLKVARSPGKESVIDLDALVEFLCRFQAPPLTPVEKSPDLSTTPEVGLRGTPEVDLRGQEGGFSLWNSPEMQPGQGDGAGEGGADPGDNKQSLSDKGFVESKSDMWNSRETLREFPHPSSLKPASAYDSSTAVSPPSPPPEKSNGSGRGELRIPPLADVLDDPRIPEPVKARRKYLIEQHPEALRRQVIEEIVRLELRTFGLKVSAIHEFFRTVPLDGMLWWINQAHAKASRNKGGFIATIFKRTGGAIPAQEGATG